MSAIRVKVPTASMIDALEARLAEGEKAKVENDKLQKEYQKALATYAKEVAAVLTKSGCTVDTVSIRDWRGVATISYNVPEKVKFPQAPDRSYDTKNRVLHDHQAQEIKNALFLLRMSNEPFINTSAYKDVVAYL